MNSESVKMFRSALGGFNRDDVTNYIKETDQKHADALAEVTALLEEANRKNEELSAQIEEAQSANDELNRQLAEVTAQRDEARNENEQAVQTFHDLREKLAAAEADLRKVTEEADAREDAWAKEKDALAAEHTAAFVQMKTEYEKKLVEGNESLAHLTQKTEELSRLLAEKEVQAEPVYDPNDHSSPAYKLEMYDKISSQLGDILINANRNADDILTTAHEEAERLRIDAELECEQKRADCDSEVARIREETAEEAAYIRERLSSNAASMLSTVSADLHINIENCIREMNSCITDMQYEMQALLSKITSRSDEMNDRISYYQSCVSEGIEKKLSGMDEKYGIRQNADGELYES